MNSDISRLRRSAPIIIAFGNTHQAAQALLGGADDFVRVPVSAEELIVRIDRLAPARGFHAGGVWVALEPQCLRTPTAKVSLHPAEYQILRMLLSRPGAPVSRELLIWQAFGRVKPSSRVLDVRVSSLRRKLSELQIDGSTPAIEAVRGQGYRLV